MSRADIGPYLRDLREHFGLTQQDVSERLHIRLRYLQAIEEGKLEVMPGKAYAKGYVHTYAEFLGIDPDQAVEISFGPEKVREEQRHFVPEPMKRNSKAMPGQWRMLAVFGIVIALGFLLVAQFSTGDEGVEEAVPMVEAVPEDMLKEMRNLVMPTTANYRCLTGTALLPCMRASEAWGVIAPERTTQLYYFELDKTRPTLEAKPKPVEEKKEEKPEAKKEEKKPAIPADAPFKRAQPDVKKEAPKAEAKKPDAKTEEKKQETESKPKADDEAKSAEEKKPVKARKPRTEGKPPAADDEDDDA
jgi:cytoskeleton protein RodZ